MGVPESQTPVPGQQQQQSPPDVAASGGAMRDTTAAAGGISPPLEIAQPPPTAAAAAALPPSYDDSAAQKQAQAQPTPGMMALQSYVQPVALGSLGPHPAVIQCPWCYAHVQTRIEESDSSMTMLAGVGLCLICVCCACIPCMAKWCQDVEHFCPNCKHRVARVPYSSGHCQPIVPAQVTQTQPRPQPQPQAGGFEMSPQPAPYDGQQPQQLQQQQQQPLGSPQPAHYA
ncbi:LITAF-like zinc ribbon domain-containing protein [Xylariaceae sp. FL0804]|nr:LITAF-like zinc ribbon domain-containing protein [Xylariaceae sp. FL0804]